MTNPTLPAWAQTQIDAYWADFLGCTPADLRPAQPTITRSDKSPGLTAFRAGGDWIIALAPDADMAAAETVLPLLQTSPLDDPAVHAHLHDLMRGFGYPHFFGPCELLYVTQEGLRPLPTALPPLRPLQPEDADLLADFARAMGGRVDYHFADPAWEYLIGCLSDERLSAAGGVYGWSSTIAEIYADTHPDYRRRGLASAIIYETTRWIVAQHGRIAQSAADMLNVSRQIVRQVGYLPYGQLFMNNLSYTD